MSEQTIHGALALIAMAIGAFLLSQVISCARFNACIPFSQPVTPEFVKACEEASR